MSPANNSENWVPEPSDLEVSKLSSHTIDCPFYSVVPTPSNEDEEVQAVKQVYQLSPGLSASENADEADQVDLEAESSPEIVEGEINAEAILDWELDQVPMLDISDGETSDENNDNVSQANHQDHSQDPEPEINQEFNQLLELNQDLRNANDDLYAQVEGLTEALRDTEAELQRQKKRANVTESMLAQQNQELAAAQSQIELLFQQLETSQQNVQRQEVLMETYRANLETSQQKLAKIERECAHLQAVYQEQSQQLNQSETVCRELRTRLMRQQRQTLQFKAALEKCLDSPLPSTIAFVLMMGEYLI